MNQLIQFSIENFLSFSSKQTIALFNSADENLKSNLIPLKNEKFTVSPVIAIYGANSSGKTNLLKAFGFLKLLLTTSSHQRISDKIPYLPFKLNNGQPTKFEIIFISNSIRYGYSVTFDQNRVLSESLVNYPSQKPKKIFQRSFIQDGEYYLYEYSREHSSLLKDIEKKSLPNKFFLSTLAEWCNLEDIKNSFDFFQNKIIINIDFENPNWQHYTAEKLENDENLKNLFLKLLKEINPDIKDIRSKVIKKIITMDELPSEMPIELKMLMTKGENITTDVKLEYMQEGLTLDLSEESRGIKKLFEIGGPILEILNKGDILIFDELETSLHPLLSRKLIELFQNKQYNKYGAQLIFSTHDTNLLDLDFLRKDQIWITERGSSTEYSTVLTSLSNIKGIKKDENIRKGFLQGKYTRIPFLTGHYLNHNFFNDEGEKE